MMDDQFFKELFKSYEPRLSSDNQFIDRLERKLEAVETLKEHNAALRKRCRKAIIAAAIAGFATGIAFSLGMPYIAQSFSNLKLHLPDYSLLQTLAGNSQLLMWPIACATSLFIAINTYEISLSLQSEHSAIRQS